MQVPMPPVDRFREVILAALGLASLLPMGCQAQGEPAAAGQFDGSGLDGSAEVLTDAGGELIDSAEVSTDVGGELSDVPVSDLADTEVAEIVDAVDAESLDQAEVCIGQIRCYDAATVKAAVESAHCYSKKCLFSGGVVDAGADAEVAVCQPIPYKGPLPPEGCPGGQPFIYDECQSASTAWIKDGMCCYQFCTTCQCGRPLWVQGELRLPALSVEQAPAAAAALDPALGAIANAWREDARDEHAAIASFHRLGLELMAAGAPAELLLATAQGAVDECHHAKACLQLAELADGRSAALGPMDLSGIALRSDLAELAVAAIAEGCVGETLAALRAATAGELAGKDTAAGRHQQRIAQDELNHAALGWRVVAWALGANGALRETLEQAFDEAIAAGPPDDPRSAALSAIDPALLHAWGRLTPQETRRSDARALGEVVSVCARALFASAVAPVPAASVPAAAAC